MSQQAIRTVVLTAISGFTELAKSLSREELLALLENHERLLLPVVQHFGGRVVKTLGDAFLLTFELPTHAVLAATVMQARIREHGDGVEMRIAMDTGEVEVAGDEDSQHDVFGRPVNIASRIEAVTTPGEIYFTETTHLAMDKSEVPTSQVDQFHFKGMQDSVTVYRVIQEDGDLRARVRESGTAITLSGEVKGLYSRGLLYAHDQQGLSNSRATGATGRWVFASVVLLIAAAGVWTGGQRLYFRHQLSTARELIASQKGDQALAMLTGLRDRHPSDARIPGLISQALRARVDTLREAGGPEEAMRLVTQYETQYPFITGFPEMRRDIRIDQATAAGIAGEREFKKIVQEFGESDPIPRIRYIEYAISNPGATVGAGVMYARQLVATNPAYMQADWMLPLAKQFVTSGGLSHLNKNNREFIGANFYGELKPFLLENVYTVNQGTLRWNCLDMLESQGDLDEVSLLRVYVYAILDRNGVPLVWKERIRDYLDTRTRQEGLEALRNEITFPVPEPEVLGTSNYDQDWQRSIIAELLYAHLREDVIAIALERKGDYTRRKQALHLILLAKDREHPELEMKFHMNSLDNHFMGPGWQEALEYLAKVEDRNLVGPPVMERLKAIERKALRIRNEGAANRVDLALRNVSGLQQ